MFELLCVFFVVVAPNLIQFLSYRKVGDFNFVAHHLSTGDFVVLCLHGTFHFVANEVGQTVLYDKMYCPMPPGKLQGR